MSKTAKKNTYGQFCPVAMAAEIFCARWTPLLLRELMQGSMRFNDIRRGVPRMSPTLLSERLKELEKSGLISARRNGGATEYQLTPAGEDLRGVVMSLGIWGHRWIESKVSLRNLDPTLLMWDMRRNIMPTVLPPHRCTVKFIYPELGSGRKSYWLVIEGGEVELCMVDPGFDVNLNVRSSLHSMTSVWMGMTTLKDEIDAGNILVEGEQGIARSIHQWLGLNPLAREKRMAG